ncbi:MFS transporter [Streptomyces inusitatus]|uniref:MFS transporter n=1 Tax=Streptomyces inusitatus TaxID=68221 RepID=A0A918QT33_9ACTN|nr:MFS transporter [Streptomyces inusitatus]GGZ65352.1 MFS transporter [Streptomyces inusitatus]
MPESDARDGGGEAVTTERRSQPVPLGRNRGFQLLWTGSAFSTLGLETADLAFPLLVLAVTGSPAAAGLVGAVQMTTALVLGLPAGELADRFDRRALLLIVESSRAVAVGSIVVAQLTDELVLAHLLAVAAVMGAMRPLAATARMLLIRTVVPPEQLTAALTREEVRINGASLAGPPLGGALFAVGRAVPFLATTLTLVVSVVCVALMRPKASGTTDGEAAPAAPPPQEGSSALRRILGGIALVWRNPLLRRTTLFTAVMNSATAPMILIVVVQLQRQEISSALIGVATAGLALGGLAGAALVTRLHRLPPAALMLGQAGSVAVLLCLLGLSLGPWWAAGVLFLTMLAVPAMRVLVDVVMFRQVPDEQRGRVISAVMTLWGLGAAGGTLLAGVLLDFLSPPVILIAIAALLAVVFFAALASRDFRATAWPAEAGRSDR